MRINEIILDNFKQLLKKQKTATFYKVDFHIHTPGSKNDYKVDGNLYEDVDLETLIKIACDKGLNKIDQFEELYCGKDELMALLIIHEAYEVKGLNLMVITDHNNMDYYEYIRVAAEKNIKNTLQKGKQFMVLPGVEITCFSGTHIIGIFDNKEYEKVWNYIKFELNGMPDQDRKIFTDKSEMDVVKVIKKANGIVYIPHLDNNAGKQRIKDMLNPLSGNSKAQLLTSKDVDAIGCSNYAYTSTVRKALEDKNNPYYRQYPLGYLQDSDAHCIEEIATKTMYVKMEKPCFDSLKFALEDPNLRVKYENDIKDDIPFIQGVTIAGGYLSKNPKEYSYYPFCKDLNCIIGGRGSGKSTLIKCIESCLKQTTPDYKFRLFMGKFRQILIYIYFKQCEYCVVCEPTLKKDKYSHEEVDVYGSHVKGEIVNISNWIKVYKISEKKCTLLNPTIKYEFLNEFYVDYFDQAEILRIGQDTKIQKRFMETLIIKTKDKDNYIELNKKIKDIQNNISKNEKITSSDDIANLKKCLYDIGKCNNQIDIIIENMLAILNNSMKNKVLIEYQRIKHSQLYLTDNCLEMYSLNNELTEYQNKKLSRLIENLISKYDLFEINKKIINEKGIFSNEIKKTRALDNQIKEELENDNTTFNKYIDIFFEISRQALKNVCNNNDELQYTIKFNVNSHEANRKKDISKDISELSLGQRAVAILTIITEGMTKLDVKTPLIIDQPEDQLDNRFIYEHLIHTIRRLKEKKQIIFVTHNANIPVCGDAENVMCLTSDNENGWIDKYGSLENDKVQKRIIEILEGGEESFRMRLRKYEI